MRLGLALAIVLLVGSACGSGPPDDGAVIWRGFEHDWQYNHRINRLGSRAVDRGCGDGEADCGGFLLAAGASGTGPDTASWRSHFTKVVAGDTAFAQATAEITLNARHSGLVDRPAETLTLSGADFPNLRDRDSYEVVLNGFDLVAVDGSADKLVSFSLSTGEADWSAADDAVQLSYGVALTMDCTSRECSDTGFAYRVKLDFLVIGWDSDLVRFTRARVDKVDIWAAHPWCVTASGEVDGPGCIPLGDGANPNAEELEPERITGVLPGVPGPLEAVPAFQGFSVSLGEANAPETPKEQHFLSFHVALHPESYDPNTGEMAYTADLTFKNWARGMQEASDAAVFSYPESGAATWTADIALIQFDSQSASEHATFEGELEWPGQDRPADGPEAEVWSSVEFNQDGSSLF